jgi:beta-barrel assembly-enhancing protease
MQNRIKKLTWKSALLGSGILLVVATLPLACKQDGSGGGGFGGLSKVFQPAVSAAGGAAGIDTRITDSAVASIKLLEEVNVGPANENGMGQAVAVTLTNKYPLTKDEKLNKYVSLVGLAIVNASNRPVGNWTFGVLETNEVNAFAGPNGYIFVTRGALNRMDNEAQLAGVLAHEVTHVLHHHGLEGVKSNATADFAKSMAKIHIDDSTGLLSGMVAPTLITVVEKGYGQDQELDADANAIRLMAAAGYDPNGLPQFLQKLESAGGGPFSTHPGKPQRISKANAQIAQLGNPNQGKTLKERFAKNVVVR